MECQYCHNQIKPQKRSRKVYPKAKYCSRSCFRLDQQRRVSTKIIKPKGRSKRSPSPKRWTIQQCLVLLGAPRDEVYFGQATRGHSRNRPKHYFPLAGSNPNKQITDYLQYPEIWEWGQNLYKQTLTKYHPDIQAEEDREYYTEKLQLAGQAFKKLERILAYHHVSGCRKW